MKDYVPQRIDGEQRRHGESFWTFKVSAVPCEVCATPTVFDLSGSTFPIYYKENFRAQCSNAGIAIRGYARSTGVVCIECAKSGATKFTCSLCNLLQPSCEIKESFGDPSDHLCRSCYITVSASVWDKKVEELGKEHEYDFE